MKDERSESHKKLLKRLKVQKSRRDAFKQLQPIVEPDYSQLVVDRIQPYIDTDSVCRHKPTVEAVEVLVPIFLHLELDGIKLTDAFTWNLNEAAISPTAFATILCCDMKLSTAFIPLIASSIGFQLESFQHQSMRETDLRIMVRLDLTIGAQCILDEFEWDIADNQNCPEAFATSMAADLNLSHEFITAIAHSIHSQSNSAKFTNHSFLDPVSPGAVLRVSRGPVLVSMTGDMMLRKLSEANREARRVMRLSKRSKTIDVPSIIARTPISLN